MESRAFIREARVLIEDITAPNPFGATLEEEVARNKDLQKRITNLFQGLQNPTLPSAFNLRDAALAHNFSVNPQVLHRLQQFDTV
jgi:hypothetical protein